MPIYEFVCLDCGNQFEKLQSFSDTTMPSCSQCHSERIQKRLSPPAVHFKGSGWYITDSKNDSRSASSKSGSEPGGASSDNGGSSTKPAEMTKTESASKEGARTPAKAPAS